MAERRRVGGTSCVEGSLHSGVVPQWVAGLRVLHIELHEASGCKVVADG